GSFGLCGWPLCTNHVCGYHYVNDGLEVGAQTPGDCHHNVCNGMGVIVNRVYDVDVPADDGDTCSSEICTDGVPSHPRQRDGSSCTGVEGGICQSDACGPTFMVVRVGEGTNPLTNASTAVFVERRYFDSMANLISTVTMPTAVNGAQQPLTMSGTATSE